MKRVLAAAIAVACASGATAHAHVGSPNTFYQGTAGHYPVRVVIRPPTAVPGLAEISVRVEMEGVKRVTVLPVLFEAKGSATPPPDEARRVPGEQGLFSSELWLMSPGAYKVEVAVDGEHGEGSAVIPLTVATLERKPLSGGLTAVLIAIGALLLLGAVAIAGAAAGESTADGASDPKRARAAMAGAAVVVAFAAWQWGDAWRTFDRDFRQNALAKPVPMNAAARIEGGARVVALSPGDQGPMRRSWARLVPDHAKLMHVFAIRVPAQDVFAHLHPIRRGDEAFDIAVPPLPAGEYALYADVTFEDGVSHTLVGAVKLPEPAPGEAAAALERDPDDSWTQSPKAAAAGARYDLGGGLQMEWRAKPPVEKDQDRSLDFVVTGTGAVELAPYMGMLGHAAIRSADGSVVAHVHPVGSISMAAQTIVQGGGDEHAHHHMEEPAASQVSFPFGFPKAGPYRVWVQVKTGEVVRTGVFDVDVTP